MCLGKSLNFVLDLLLSLSPGKIVKHLEKAGPRTLTPPKFCPGKVISTSISKEY